MKKTKVQQTDFSKGKVWKNIISVAIPLTIAQIINILYSVVDRFFIGSIKDEGTLALTGVGLCFPIISLITAFAMLFGVTGGAVLFSIERGKKNTENAKTILGTTTLLLILSGVIITLVGLLFLKPILFFFGASDFTYPYARQYGSIYLIGTVFALLSLGLNAFINALGFAKIGMTTVLIGAILNTILDPIFIFGFRMGIRGAAIATVISQIVSALCVVGFLGKTREEARLEASYLKIKVEWMKKIVALGTSGFVMGCTNSLVQIVCNKMAFTYGGDLYVGVMTVLFSIREIIQTPLSGLTSGATPVVSYNYGGKQLKRVKKAVNFTTMISVSYAFFAWLIVFSFPELFVRIFNKDAEFIKAGVHALHLYFFAFFMMALQMTGQNVFLALAKTKQAIFFSLLRKVIIVVPLTFILPAFWQPPIDGVFVAEPISNIIGGAACYITMRFMLAKEMQKN
ncbi:MAG TPA: MATE family efflux transporter [Candidatus Dorea intestinavium]|nr:MATE family efflux transporter [Candidatus Dorea intestinavium]